MKIPMASKSKNRGPVRHKGLIIRPRGDSWQVDFGTQDGKRTQRSYENLTAARKAVDRQILQRSEADRIARVQKRDKEIGWENLPERDKLDAVTAIEKLNGRVTLLEAVTHYLESVPGEENQKTVTQVYDLYIAGKEFVGRRPQTLNDYRKAGRFADDLGKRFIHTLKADDLEAWLNSRRYTGTTRANYRRHLRMLFNFALQRGYARENVALALPQVTVDETLPSIFTVEEVRRLMANVRAAVPSMVPYFAIGIFAGVRPAEIQGLDWRDINLDKQRIAVRPEVAKKRRQRYVDISANLIEWLLPYRKTRGGIVYLRKRFERGRRNSKGTPVAPWAPDIMRHTYGSYHVAMHNDPARTAMQMGHRGQDVLFAHYVDLCEKEKAEEFWEIRPMEGTKHDLPVSSDASG